MQDRKLEELLESVYTEREQGRSDMAGVLARAGDHAEGKSEADFAELESLELVRRAGGSVALTEAGERRARDVVRRHRLAERLLKDLLELGDRTIESQACEFEHILSQEATDSVCTLLGHPPTCPHGSAIPPGPCCSATARTLRPLVTGLPHFELGVPGRIVFIAPKFHDRMDRLAALGVIPGSPVRLHQRSPSYVIEVGETTIALDPEIAGEVFVKRV